MILTAMLFLALHPPTAIVSPWREAMAAFRIDAVDDTELRLGGTIRPGDETRFAAALRPTTRRLTVNSAGGAASAAIAMARTIERHRLTVVVDGICASSCANYLFAAGAKRIVRGNSLLLWHGAPDEVSRVDMNAQLAEAMRAIGASSAQIDEARRAENARLDGWVADQNALYRRQGLDTAVLYRLNHGMAHSATDGMPMLALSHQALRCAGFAFTVQPATRPVATGGPVRIIHNPALEAELCRRSGMPQ